MPITWTKIYYDTKRQDQLQSVADDSGNVTQTIIRTYMVVAAVTGPQPSIFDAATASMSGVTVPLCGGYYTVDGQAGFRCTSSIPKRTSESPHSFELQITFVRKFSVPTGQAAKWNVDISIKGQKFQQTAYQDKDGNDIVNGAKQPFTEPSLTKTYYDEVFDISYMTYSEGSEGFSTLRGKTNQGDVTFNIKGVSRSFGARQLLVDDITVSSTITLNDNSTPVWKVTATFIARKDAFTDHVKNVGYYELNGGKLLPIMKDQAPVTVPANLDKNGAKLDDSSTAEYLDFKVEDEADFNSFFIGLA